MAWCSTRKACLKKLKLKVSLSPPHLPIVSEFISDEEATAALHEAFRKEQEEKLAAQAQAAAAPVDGAAALAAPAVPATSPEAVAIDTAPAATPELSLPPPVMV